MLARRKMSRSVWAIDAVVTGISNSNRRKRISACWEWSETASQFASIIRDSISFQELRIRACSNCSWEYRCSHSRPHRCFERGRKMKEFKAIVVCSARHRRFHCFVFESKPSSRQQEFQMSIRHSRINRSAAKTFRRERFSLCRGKTVILLAWLKVCARATLF